MTFTFIIFQTTLKVIIITFKIENILLVYFEYIWKNDRNQKSAGLPKEQRGIMMTATINIQTHLLMSTWINMITMKMLLRTMIQKHILMVFLGVIIFRWHDLVH